ncbi:efflux transporter outer membrane subunit [Carboxylicivirga linearis]|uniref:TolC family protein n=1 Tax=Carboxylicivirga linearis TaxID=1628157 RepID=A0ABS5JSX4_9BACT|nr:TolC family protein [Carboxylicivirga linearis]MBS2097629.1 TolC family protein [Carboxylicivirga linearis]
MKNTIYLFITIIFLGIVSSCRMGKNYSQPEMDIPQTFINSDDTTFNASIKWWDVFDDPTLDTLIATALKNNYDILATAQRVEAAMHALNIQKAEMLPKFGYQGQAQRGNFALIQTEDVMNNFSVFGQASWELDFWGKYRRLNENAKAQYLASEYGLASLKLSLISTVASTYFTLLEYREKTEIAIQTYATRDSSLNIIQQRFEAGIIPEIDVNQAQIQKAIAAKAIPLNRRLAKKAENALKVLLGENPGGIVSDVSLQSIEGIPDIPPGVPADILLRRPDILQAEQELVAQNALVGVALANRLPSISLTGMLGLASNDLSQLTSGDPAWNINGSLLGPIFSWNQNINRVRAEKNNKEAAIYNYKNVALNAFREVEDALITIETLKEENAAVKEHVRAAQNALLLSADRYDKGVASYIEFLENQRQAFDAQISLVGNEKLLLEAYIKLYQALGGGWE